MKSLFRFVATVGLIGGTFFMGLAQRAIALPQEQLLEKLWLPVFMVTTENGELLSVPISDNQQVTSVFLSSQAALDFRNSRSQAQPELGTLRVVGTSMGDVYTLDTQETSLNNIIFKYIPIPEQMVSTFLFLCKHSSEQCPAENVQFVEGLQRQLSSSPRNLSEEQVNGLTRISSIFDGVPVFVITDAQGNYLPIDLSNNGQTMIPFFFELEQLGVVFNQVKEKYPDQANAIGIEITTLENVIETMVTQDTPQVRKFELVPTRETFQLMNQSNNNNQP